MKVLELINIPELYGFTFYLTVEEGWVLHEITADDIVMGEKVGESYESIRYSRTIMKKWYDKTIPNRTIIKQLFRFNS